jgi:hypothetical protein
VLVGDNGVFYVMVRAMVVPILAVSGLPMWQMPRLQQ